MAVQNSRADYCASYSAQLFQPAEISASQARSQMQCHDGMHLLGRTAEKKKEQENRTYCGYK
jgi:hypothetical protein